MTGHTDTPSLWRSRDYRHLFGAQLVALAGNGLATVALGLLAFELAGPNAAAVLGTALAIKMLTYVVLAPIAAATAGRFDRRRFLVTLDLVRAAVALTLPFIDQVWQVFVLVALMQSASAAFTPTFQATLPEVLPDEQQYRQALSYSQLASTLESLLSPLLAALLISLVSFHWLFAGTAVGFTVSAALVLSSHIPDSAPQAAYGVLDRIFSGVRVVRTTPRLRGLMGLNLAVAASGSIVIVNTVNLVLDELDRPESDVALLLAANGAGVLAIAFAMPRLLDHLSERTVMLTGAGIAVLGALAAVATTLNPIGAWTWPTLLGIWLTIGVGTGAILTPTGNVLRRSSSDADRPALFAAQFSLSHACWLLTYPVAGWVATAGGYQMTWIILAALTAVGTALALRSWPVHEPAVVAHRHPARLGDCDHVSGATLDADGYLHSHNLVIDDLHRRWPTAKRLLVA